MRSIYLNNDDFINNPYPVYCLLRELDEPYWLPHSQLNSTSRGVWLFSRYADAVEILKIYGNVSKQLVRVRPPEQISPLDLTMINHDPPEHTRLRNLVKQAFTPEKIKLLEPAIERIVDQLITNLEQKQTGDFIEDFALPLPLLVLADLIGIPYDDHDIYCRWITCLLDGYDSVLSDKEKLDRQKAAMQEIISYFNELIVVHRKQPMENLISSLIEVQDSKNGLTADELLGVCILFLVAGYETTVNLIGNAMYTFLYYPEQFRLLRQHPELLPSAIEETLRFESPLQRSTFRITTGECILGGKKISEGEQICAVIGAANRDPVQFPDPDTFDIRRTPNRHLAFGLGIHNCLGATLARTEARVFFGHLIKRSPNIQPGTGTPEWKDATLFRGLRTLPVYY